MPRSGRPTRTAGRLSLELDLGAQVLGIAPDRRDGEGPAGAAVGHPAVPGLDLPVDVDLVPLCRMLRPGDMKRDIDQPGAGQFGEELFLPPCPSARRNAFQSW